MCFIICRWLHTKPEKISKFPRLKITRHDTFRSDQEKFDWCLISYTQKAWGEATWSNFFLSSCNVISFMSINEGGGALMLPSAEGIIDAVVYCHAYLILSGHTLGILVGSRTIWRQRITICMIYNGLYWFRMVTSGLRITFHQICLCLPPPFKGRQMTTPQAVQGHWRRRNMMRSSSRWWCEAIGIIWSWLFMGSLFIMDSIFCFFLKLYQIISNFTKIYTSYGLFQYYQELDPWFFTDGYVLSKYIIW